MLLRRIHLWCSLWRIHCCSVWRWISNWLLQWSWIVNCRICSCVGLSLIDVRCRVLCWNLSDDLIVLSLIRKRLMSLRRDNNRSYKIRRGNEMSQNISKVSDLLTWINCSLFSSSAAKSNQSTQHKYDTQKENWFDKGHDCNFQLFPRKIIICSDFSLVDSIVRC